MLPPLAVGRSPTQIQCPLPAASVDGFHPRPHSCISQSFFPPSTHFHLLLLDLVLYSPSPSSSDPSHPNRENRLQCPARHCWRVCRWLRSFLLHHSDSNIASYFFFCRSKFAVSPLDPLPPILTFIHYTPHQNDVMLTTPSPAEDTCYPANDRHSSSKPTYSLPLPSSLSVYCGMPSVRLSRNWEIAEADNT